MGFTAKFKDVFLGKKDKGTFDQFSKLSEQQQKLQDFYNKQLIDAQNISPEATVQAQLNNEERAIRAGAGDNVRQAQSLVSQRGLGNSSVGLNALLSAGRGLGDKIIQSRAQAPMLIQQGQNDRLNRMMGITDKIGGIESQRAYFKGAEGTGRGGGMLGNAMQAAGTFFGGMYGGPSGAKAGGQLGKSDGQALANM